MKIIEKIKSLFKENPDNLTGSERPSAEPFIPTYCGHVISEPVISFLKTFKQNPRRFKMTWVVAEDPYKWPTCNNITSYDYTITDRVTQEIYTGRIVETEKSMYLPYSLSGAVYSCPWLNSWEIDFLSVELLKHYRLRKGVKLKERRRDRLAREAMAAFGVSERLRLTEMYQ